MGSKGWIKRGLPFFATFAIGIFIAGLFGFGGPRFGRHGRWQMRAEMERLRFENEDLKNENLRLRNLTCEDGSSESDYRVKTVLPVDPPIIQDLPSRPPAMPHHPPRR